VSEFTAGFTLRDRDQSPPAVLHHATGDSDAAHSPLSPLMPRSCYLHATAADISVVSPHYSAFEDKSSLPPRLASASTSLGAKPIISTQRAKWDGSSSKDHAAVIATLRQHEVDTQLRAKCLVAIKAQPAPAAASKPNPVAQALQSGYKSVTQLLGISPQARRVHNLPKR